MSFSDEYLPANKADEDIEEYPTAFGVTFNPRNSGIAAAIVGLLASLYLAMNWVLPAYNEYQQLKTDEATKQQQLDQQKGLTKPTRFEKLKSDLAQKQAVKSQILSMFADQNDLNTILIDVDKVFKARNVELNSFQPVGDAAIVSDSSLGAAVNNKLKRQSYSVKMKANYENTQNVLRDLERLQPLILIKNINTQGGTGGITGKVFKTGKNTAQVVADTNKPVETTFSLDMILPLTPEEVAKLAPPPAPAGQPGQPPAGGAPK
ncbi:MAG: hypothetical protein N5P05_003137 [Chroococcopsis gigantea SAG 12.99]|jgi:type IV pilus assembly protein PilO|nr:pilus assembly protein [Chlorogloea purpurea SAG 13.99]MDV3001531.1 hypothetical protein [Chroococcopsis gigantea SAG 12.99]